ncbi:hypothetical protein JZ751_022963 [Albula glossodonta]|uniref:Small ribosomal subunit protein mS31 n=1 Tax=Albula glossodonta TaxID=121402 RepID=A0A8T2PMJ6_9TELE|nr:hypothetical protein JZ751_022963 [Albula glossodonta]
MYRRLLLLVSQGRNPSIFAQEAGFVCNVTLPIYRAAIPGGHKCLGTSSAVCCEVKEEPEPEQKKDGEKKTEHVKSGKENLLDLLGSMKVKVTTKKRVQDLKANSKELASHPTPDAMESTVIQVQKAIAESPPQRESLSPELVAAASAAASVMPNRNQAESELLKQLRKHEAVALAQRKGDGKNIGSIIADMKVGRPFNTRKNARLANQIRFDDDGRGYTHDRSSTSELDGAQRRGLFVGKRLNIFSPVGESPEADALIDLAPTLWDLEFANQITSAAQHVPRNGFEEMIQWTKEGKLWEYPVNNEAGLEEEAIVPFHEHIFLEKHLEDGFPQQGPVRHFMELVVAGLVKNPHLTVRQKTEHIVWFRDYFQQKDDILKKAEVYLS